MSGKKLTGDEIKAIFVGNTFHWRHAKRSDSGKTYFEKNGTSKGVKNGQSRKSGWAVRGDKLCFTGEKKICREVESNGKGGYYLVKNGSKRVVVIEKIEPGNTI